MPERLAVPGSRRVRLARALTAGPAVVVAAGVVVLLAGCSRNAAPAQTEPTVLVAPSDAQTASVVRHVDGDTVVLRGEGEGPLGASPTKVRLLLVDTPEVFGAAECHGEQASQRTAELLPVGASVQVESDLDLLDRYDRTLLLVWTPDGRSVQEVLVREGHATVLQVGRNRAGLGALEQAQEQAERAGAGLWTECQAEPRPH